jgi:hypothetical protein
MSDLGKPGGPQPLYGVWLKGAISKIRADVLTAEAAANEGLRGGSLDPAQRAEVEKALKDIKAALGALGP